MNFIETGSCRLDPVLLSNKFHTTTDVLRLDLVHPVISGNKWFKLKGYINDAVQQQKKILITFGGAWSNHLVATAAAAAVCGLKSVGIVRGEQPPVLSATLTDAQSYGMQLIYINRDDYRHKRIPSEQLQHFDENDLYFINEGGYGVKGMEAAADILPLAGKNYTHILAAVGTGTTLAGIAFSALPHQQVIGISVMKNNLSLDSEVNNLLPPLKHAQVHILHDYHFGGYAKSTTELFHFMNDWYLQTNIPSDFVYTGKLFYAYHHLLHNNYFPEGSKVLLIHSGGLQGNRSLPNGTLIF
jgi:1-aminocyclopropane-1-carboxylate deaminase